MKTFITAAIMLLLSYAPVLATHDRPMCAERSKIIQDIAETHGETLKSSGVSHGGSLVEVFSNDQTGSWTIILTRNGTTGCIASDGTGYEMADVPSGVPA